MSEPKYKIGERVAVRIVSGPDTFEWAGVVVQQHRSTGPGYDYQWRYRVAGAPTSADGALTSATEGEVSPADPTKPYFAADGTLCNADGSRSIFDDVDQ